MLDIREFVVGVWNYCTYDTVLMAKVLAAAAARQFFVQLYGVRFHHITE